MTETATIPGSEVQPPATQAPGIPAEQTAGTADHPSGNPQPNVPSVTGQSQTGQSERLIEYLQTDDVFANQTSLDPVKLKLAMAYAKRLGITGNVETIVDPATIMMIIDMVLSFIKKCQETRAARGTAATPAAISEQYIKDAKDRGFVTEVLVRRHVRQELRDMYGPLAYRRYDGDVIANAILDAGAGATTNEVKPLVQLAMAA
jgi:hypothetical protein